MADNQDAKVDFLYSRQPTILWISPSVGPVAGGTGVMAVVDGGLQGMHPVCRFGEEAVQGMYLTSSTVSCVTPRRLAPSNTTMRVSADGAYFSKRGAEYIFEDSGVLFSIFPRIGPSLGGTNVVLKARGLVDCSALLCMIGDQIILPLAANSTTVSCVTRRHPQGSVRVQLLRGAQVLSGGGLTFMFVDMPRIVRIVPSLGSTSGGTVVNIYVLNTYRAEALCSFCGITIPTRIPSALYASINRPKYRA